MIFLSLGSNYTLKQSLKHLLIRGRDRDAEALKQALTERYQGSQTTLFSQGRGALSEAVRLASGGRGNIAVTSMTCFVVIEAIKAAGCQPLYVDVEPESLQFTAATLREALEGKDVKAVIVQNTLGVAVDIEVIIKLARDGGAVVIEDIAHGVGGRYDNGQEIGTAGDYTMLSFGRDKLLDTINGGALVVRTDDRDVEIQVPSESVPMLQQLRDRIYPVIAWKSRTFYGIGVGKYILALAYKLGLAARSADGGTHPDRMLPSWQARLALAQVEKLDQAIAAKLARQKAYVSQLPGLMIPTSSNGVRLPVLADNRDQVQRALKAQGYYTEDVWYEVPVSPERLYDTVNFPEAACPAATQVSRHILNLPTHQLVTDQDIKKITAIVRETAVPWKQ